MLAATPTRQAAEQGKENSGCVRVFLPGFLCSNLQSPDVCKHCAELHAVRVSHN